MKVMANETITLDEANRLAVLLKYGLLVYGTAHPKLAARGSPLMDGSAIQSTGIAQKKESYILNMHYLACSVLAVGGMEFHCK